MKPKEFTICLVEKINRVIGSIGIVAMLALTSITVLDIVMRRFFSAPLAFSYEVTQLLVVVIVFCSIPYATGMARHVSIEVLTDRFSPRYQHLIGTMGDLFCTAVLALIGWQAFSKGMYEHAIGTMTGEMEIPLYPFYLVVSGGACIAAITLLIQTVSARKKAAK